MGNADYKEAFDRIVLPIATQFNPDLILIAAGFDAAAADMIGEYILTTDMYGYMTKRLKSVSKNGKMLLSLEGGYNPKAIGEALCSCLDVLVNDTEPTVEIQGTCCKRAEQTLNAVHGKQSEFWNLKD